MLRYPKQDNLNLPENQLYLDFESRIDRFVSQLLQGYIPAKHLEIKVVHDPVWGTIKFLPWELQLLDSPLLQRLRNINQLGLAALTYPSATHSRFEHTLGVTALTSKMVDSVNDNGNTKDNDICVSKSDLSLLRLAALLHDVGHCFFSHLSEKMYGETEVFSTLKSSFEIFSSAQPHEIFAYIIINTPSFKKFFENINFPLYDSDSVTSYCGNGFFDDVGRMIIGAPIDKVFSKNGKLYKKYYLTEIINGQFDADALDYLRRDSYTTGLSLTYHIDRFLYKIKMVEREESENNQTVFGKHLTVSVSGVSTVEEMIFGKQMLTRYIYQHQKVLASDVLVYDVVRGLKANGKLQHPCDFLYYCDDDIYKIYDESGDQDFSVPVSKMTVDKDSQTTIADVVRRIKMRSLPKKALVLNMSNIEAINGKENASLNEIYSFLHNAFYSGGLRREIRDEAWIICENEGVEKTLVDSMDIFYSVPKPTTAKNYTDVFVATHDGGIVLLSEIADLNNWANEFSGRAWNCYVFSTSQALPIVSLAAKRVLERKGVKFKENKIFSNLKHHNEIEKINK